MVVAPGSPHGLETSGPLPGCSVSPGRRAAGVWKEVGKYHVPVIGSAVLDSCVRSALESFLCCVCVCVFRFEPHRRRVNSGSCAPCFRCVLLRGGEMLGREPPECLMSPPLSSDRYTPICVDRSCDMPSPPLCNVFFAGSSSQGRLSPTSRAHRWTRSLRRQGPTKTRTIRTED